MTVIVCDLCGQQISSGDKTCRFINIRLGTSEDHSNVTRSLDVCKDCLDKLPQKFREHDA